MILKLSFQESFLFEFMYYWISFDLQTRLEKSFILTKVYLLSRIKASIVLISRAYPISSKDFWIVLCLWLLWFVPIPFVKASTFLMNTDCLMNCTVLPFIALFWGYTGIVKIIRIQITLMPFYSVFPLWLQMRHMYKHSSMKGKTINNLNIHWKLVQLNTYF